MGSAATDIAGKRLVDGGPSTVGRKQQQQK
jgi:hypothetical protein